MSTNGRVVQLLIALALETAVVVGHFAYGAHRFADPERLHVVLPALAFLGLAAALSALYVWRPSLWTLTPLAAEVSLVFLVLFGGYHGGFSHALKDVFFLAGVGTERLAEIFDSPDFAPPGDGLFEASGLASLAAAALVAWMLWRVVGAARRARPS